MRRMQHIRVDVFRLFISPLSEIVFVLFRFPKGVLKKSFDETRPSECVASVS